MKDTSSGLGEVKVQIPIRNLWLLLVYASDLYRGVIPADTHLEDNPEEIPAFVAKLLTQEVQRILKRNLTLSYRGTCEELGFVKGSINVLETEAKMLLKRGSVSCTYDELTADTARNRYLRAALETAAKIVRDAKVSAECRQLAGRLSRIGVSADRPSDHEALSGRFGRYDKEDRAAVDAARLIFKLSLPTKATGQNKLFAPIGDEHWLRKLFEKAVLGFYRKRLTAWNVIGDKQLMWPVSDCSAGMYSILPTMKADVWLERKDKTRRIILDTKFTSILKGNQYGELKLSSGYVYQIYAYVRSQEETNDFLAEATEGVMLHPSISESIDESMELHGHKLRFLTVNLSAATTEMHRQILNAIGTAEVDS